MRIMKSRILLNILFVDSLIFSSEEATYDAFERFAKRNYEEKNICFSKVAYGGCSRFMVIINNEPSD